MLRYDADTGIFVRLVSVKGRGGGRVGDKAGGINGHGYVAICIDRRRYMAHRLAFLYMTGEWPTFDVDHIDGERENNRWANLRDVSRSVNLQNKRQAQSNSKTGLLGVSVDTHSKRMIARIKVGGKYLRLGYFDTAEAAHAAYLAAKREHHAGCTI